MALNLPPVSGSPISADLMYRFYDNKAITPQVLTALQKKQNEADGSGNAMKGSMGGASSIAGSLAAGKDGKDDESDKTDSKKADDKSADKPGPAARVNISEQIIRMSMASKTSKLEDLKSTVKPSEEVLAIEKKLADQKAAEEAAKAKEEGTT